MWIGGEESPGKEAAHRKKGAALQWVLPGRFLPVRQAGLVAMPAAKLSSK